MAEAISELKDKGAAEEDHAPRAQKAMEAHKAMGTAHGAMGQTCSALAKSLGVKAEGEAPPPEGEEEVDPNAPPADKDDAGEEEPTPEEQAQADKAIAAAIKKSLGTPA